MIDSKSACNNMDDKYGSRFHIRKITRINGKIGKLIKRIQEKDIVQCSSFVVQNTKKCIKFCKFFVNDLFIS